MLFNAHAFNRIGSSFTELEVVLPNCVIFLSGIPYDKILGPPLVVDFSIDADADVDVNADTNLLKDKNTFS